MELEVFKEIANSVSSRIKCALTGSCVCFAELFVRRMIENHNFKDFVIVEGYVKVKSYKYNLTRNLQHTWIMFEGENIDPTFIQFNEGNDEIKRTKKAKQVFSAIDYYKLCEQTPVNVLNYYKQFMK